MTDKKEAKNKKTEEQKDETVKTEEKTKKPAGSKAVEKLVEEIAKLSVMELSELVNALQEKLGVSAQTPVAASPTPVAADAATAQAQATAGAGSANQTVVITKVDNKIAAIKVIRELNQNIGLKEAKDMTENLPAEILKDAKAEDAKAASEKLTAAGCTVELK